MGNFLALSAVIGKAQNEVVTSLSNYAASVGGGMLAENALRADHENCCVIEEADGNTTISYPDGYAEWDASSEFISRELNATVFSFHIHDGDFWMYVMYNNGKVVDQFNPVPDYWDDDLPKKELERWKGNAFAIAQYLPFVKPKDIKNYLVKWNLDDEETSKAYPTDDYAREDWQLLDFMARLKLPYPLDEDGNAKGQTYKIWTTQLQLGSENDKRAKRTKAIVKPWWKFW
jgi:hypothetical protein